jgi:integrase
MAIGIHRLQARFVETVKTPGMYPDGGGLYFQVGSAEAKSWLFRFFSPVHRKERQMGLGPYHTIGLVEARERARLARVMVKDGIDPIDARKAKRLDQQLQAAKDVTFHTCAEEWKKRNESGWVPTTAKKYNGILKNHLEPKLGKLPTSAINVDLCEAVIKPIWETKQKTGRMAQEILKGILDWGTAKEYRTGDNPASLKGPLGVRLKPYTHTPTNLSGLPYQQIGAFLAQLRAYRGERTVEWHVDGATAASHPWKAAGISDRTWYRRAKLRPIASSRPVPSLALEFIILTGVRVDQAVNARWAEIDWNEKLWTCWRHKTVKKTKTPLEIPLSSAAIAILKTMRELQRTKQINSDYVFASNSRNLRHPGKQISTDAPRLFLRGFRPDLRIHIHGFRTTFSTWAHESGFPHDDIELALGHTVGNKISRDYNKAKRLEPRRQLMEAWAKYCARIEPLPAEVVPFRQTKK